MIYQWAINQTFYLTILMGLIRQKRELKRLNSFGRKLEIMGYYSYKKLIPLMTLTDWRDDFKGELFFFHMEPQIHAAS